MSPEGIIAQESNNMPLEPTFIFTGSFPLPLPWAFPWCKLCKGASTANVIATYKKAQHLSRRTCFLAVDIDRATETKCMCVGRGAEEFAQPSNGLDSCQSSQACNAAHQPNTTSS